MNNDLIATILLQDVYIEDYIHFLESINKIDDNISIRIKMPVDNIVDLIFEYLKHHTEFLSDLNEYDCITPNIYFDSDMEAYFALNSSDNEDDESDVIFIQKELKKQFGANFNKDVKLIEILKILLMGTKYAIIGKELICDIYYENYKESWFKDIIGKYSY